MVRPASLEPMRTGLAVRGIIPRGCEGVASLAEPYDGPGTRFREADCDSGAAGMASEPASSATSPRLSSRPPGPMQRLARWSDRMLLQRLPEYALFPSEESRLRAIKELDTELEDTRWFWRWIMWIWVFAVIVGNASFCIVPIALPWKVPVIGGLGMPAAFLVGLSAIAVTVVVWRHGVKLRLRDKLIEYGAPVCRQCGYSLRGLRPGESPQCPECGWRVDDGVCALMDRR